MHRFLKRAAAIAVIGLLASAAAGAAPRGTGRDMMGVRGWNGEVGPGMLGGRMGSGAWTDVPGWEDLKRLETALTAETAKQRVASALKDWGYADLAVDSVMECDDGFYALVKEKATGRAALEVFVEEDYGTVSASLGGGANWNTTYGRSLAWPLPSGKTISADEARKAAEQWLDRVRTAAEYELKVVELPGYYSIQLLDDGELSGLIAVNAYTGKLWYRGGRGGRFAVLDESDAG